MAAQFTCLSSYTRLNIPDAFIDQDYDLLYSGFFQNHPYMNGTQPRDFLRGLDHPDSAGKNEFHINWTDTQLNYNYFHATDSSAYYNGSSTPHMQFFTGSSQQLSDRDHIDVYLNHPLDGITWDFYPAHVDNPDVKEDLPLTNPCSEYNFNAVQSGAVYRDKRVSPNFFTTVRDSEATWFAGGEGENVRIGHESQHVFYKSIVGDDTGFPNETFSMAAEYLVGAKNRDSDRPIWNTVYDRPLVDDFDYNVRSIGLGYNHWYLWSAYLLQQFAGDTTRVEDDLLYKYVRYKEGGEARREMYGLAKVLEASAYDSLGVTANGNQRLRNLVHNYSLAKWINNPDPSFYGGRLGFTRGLVPSVTPGIFDNSFHPCAKATAQEVPPRFIVGQERSHVDSVISGHWCVTDVNQGDNCSSSQLTCDTLGVWLYGADYIQFQAAPYFDNQNQNTFHFKMTWDPAKYPGTGHSGNSLRVAAITYPIVSDSLYLRGQYTSGVIDAFVDSLHGFCEVWVPNFGTTNKSVVMAIDLGELNPPVIGRNARQLFYDYKFKVDVAVPPTSTPVELKAFKVSGTGVDSLKWTNPGNCGTSGYYIQRAFETQATPTTFDSTGASVFARAYPASGDTLIYYRVVPKGTTTCNSNFATLGGHVRQSHTISGKLYVSGDLTVDAGKTLTVSQATKVRFRPNHDSRQEGIQTNKTEVAIYGKVYAHSNPVDSISWISDAPAPAPGDWSGIRMYGSANDSTEFNYNVIRHAYHGLYVEHAKVKLDHCRIQHSTFYGIYLFGDATESPLILNCVLEQNHGAEMNVFGMTPNVRHCHFHYSPALGSGAVDDGVVYSGGGAGWFQRNRIEGVGIGLYCVSQSSPRLKGDSGIFFGRNEIFSFRNRGVWSVPRS